MLFIAGDHSTARDGEYDPDQITLEKPAQAGTCYRSIASTE